MAAWNSETVCMEELEYSSVPRGINLVGTPYLSSRFFGIMAGRFSRAYIHSSRPKNHAYKTSTLTHYRSVHLKIAA